MTLDVVLDADAHRPMLDERRFEILLENCRRFFADKPLRNVVDKASWF